MNNKETKIILLYIMHPRRLWGHFWSRRLRPCSLSTFDWLQHVTTLFLAKCPGHALDVPINMTL